MQKRLAIYGLFGAFLFGWPCVAENQQGKAHTEQNHSAQAQGPAPPAQAVIDPSTAAPHGNAKAGDAEQDPPEKPLPRFLRPEWVIVYITTVYVVITALMFLAIKRQGGLIKNQLDRMVEKERARIIVEPVGLRLAIDAESKRSWNLEATIKVDNIGISRAFDIHGWASLWVQDSSSPISHGLGFRWLDSPAFRISAEPGSYIVQVDSQIPPLTVKQFVDGITHAERGQGLTKKVIYLQGFVEYETLGVKFRRNYGWHWLPGDFEHRGIQVGDSLIEGRWWEDDTQPNGEQQAN